MKKTVILALLLSVSFIGCTQHEGGQSDNIVTLYAKKCGICHGKLGQGGTAPSHINCSICDSLDKLYEKINNEMPFRDPGACVDDCARKMARYIYEDLNGKGKKK